MSLTPSIRPTVIFSGAMWSQQLQWRKALDVLPANTCLLAVDPRNKKLTRIMRQVALMFLNRGRPVHIWLTPLAKASRLAGAADAPVRQVGATCLMNEALPLDGQFLG